MKKLIVLVVSVIMVIFSNSLLESVTVALTTVSGAEKTNRYKRPSTPEPQPGPSWRQDDAQLLSKVIKNPNLGILENVRPGTILKRLRELNPEVDINYVYVNNISDSSAIINSLCTISSKYSGSFMVIFKNDEQVDLSEAIFVKELKDLPIFTQDGILQRLQELNSEVDIKQLFVDDIEENNAVIKPLPTSKLYKGFVNVHFKKRGIIYFSKLKIRKLLGAISDYTHKAILFRLQELNPEIDVNELYIKTINMRGATIKVNPNSKIYYSKDSIEVFFTMPHLSSIIVNKNLGRMENDSKKTILKNIRSLNPGILLNHLRVVSINKNFAVIRPRKNSSLYEGEVTVTFFIEKKLLNIQNVIEVTELPIYDCSKCNTNTILENIKEFNSKVDVKQLVVRDIYNDQYAVIRPRKNSKSYWGQVTVKLVYKKSVSLSSIIKVTNLDKIPDNNASTIMHYLQSKNPNINMNEIFIEKVTWNYAIISAYVTSKLYNGSVTINFSLWRLKELFDKLDLGEISENTPTSILKRLQDLNSVIFKDDIIIENITFNSAEISVREYPVHFQLEEKITVYFKAKKLKNTLQNVLNQTVLGLLPSDNLNYILFHVQQLNPDLDVNQVYVTDFTENTAIIRARPDSNNLVGEVTIYFALKDLTNISAVTPVNYLGSIKNLLPQTIISHISLSNFELNINEIEVVNITQNSAVVRARKNSSLYQGQRIVYFSIAPSVHNLETVIPVERLNLNSISDSTPETILTRLRELNFNLNVSHLIIRNISSTSAEIIARSDSNLYTGQVTVYFNVVPERYLLDDVIMYSNLGEISANIPEAILFRLQQLNPSIVVDQLSVQDITSNSAVVVPVAGSTLYDGQVTVNFSIVSALRDLSSDLFNTFLGNLSSLDLAVIYNAISVVNPEIDINQFDVTNITQNSATLKPTPFSIYKHEVQVTFETFRHKIQQDYLDRFFIDNKENSDETKILNLTLSKKVFHKIVLVFFKKEQIPAIDEIRDILKTETKSEDKEIAILATLIWKHFSYYYELYNTLSENQSVLIQTNAVGYWDKENPWTHNKVVGEDKGFKNENFLEKILSDMNDYNENKNGKCFKESADSYDVLEGYYNINWFKLRIRFETLLYIKYLFYLNDKDTFIEKLSKLLYSFSQTSNSNFKTYSEAKADIYNTAYMIWEHFSYYQNLLYYVAEGQALVIENKSGTEKGYWDEDNPWIYNKVVGSKVEHDAKNSTNSVLIFLNEEELKFNRKIDSKNKIYDLYPDLLDLKQKIVTDVCH